MASVNTFGLMFTPELAKGSLVLALISAAVIVGLFAYVGRRTQRAAYNWWAIGWLFYAVFLAAQITLLKPKIICTLGRFGLQQLLKGDYKISEVHGKPIRSKDNTIYFPMYHPAAALHNGALRESILEDFKRLAALLKREGILK